MNPDETTWLSLISKEMAQNGDNPGNIEATCPEGEEWMKVSFDSGPGKPEGQPFTVWTKDFVYFPFCDDGIEWCRSIPRNPVNRPKKHIGKW